MTDQNQASEKNQVSNLFGKLIFKASILINVTDRLTVVKTTGIAEQEAGGMKGRQL